MSLVSRLKRQQNCFSSHFCFLVSSGLLILVSLVCCILTPTLLAITVFLSRSPGLLNRGPSLCWDMVLIPASSLQLIWTSSRRGHITIWRPPTSCERHNSHSVQPLDSQGHPLISSTGFTCYLHRCSSSFDNLAGSEVNMQQVSFLVAVISLLLHFSI